MSGSRPAVPEPYSPKAQEIIQRTNALLAAGGYNGFSYADIAELVGVRKASIHHHFPTKAELVRATVVQHRAATRGGLQALEQAHPDALERLVAYSRFWAECIEQAQPPICICALLAAELPAVPAEVAGEVKAHFDELHAWVATAMEQGAATKALRLRDTAAAEAATFVASVHGAMLAARAAGQATLFWTIAKLATDRLKAQ